MTIKEQLDHALEYRYPVKVFFTKDSCSQTGMIWCDGSGNSFTFDESGKHYRQYSDVVTVEPIVLKAPSILDEEWALNPSGYPGNKDGTWPDMDKFMKEISEIHKTINATRKKVGIE